MITILTLIGIKYPLAAVASGVMPGDETATLTQKICTVKSR